MNRARGYLRLPLVYAAYLDGLRWSPSDNVLERSDGGAFVFSLQIAEFLEGFASRRPVLHFPLIVHLLSLLGDEPGPNAPDQRARLWGTFLATGKNMRHAGAFCAHLCRSLPDALSRDELVDVCRRLRSPEQIVHWSVVGASSDGVNIDAPIETPPMEPEGFEAFVIDGLRSYSDEELIAWLHDGRPPVQEAAQALAHALPLSPSSRLDALLERPRLSPAHAFLRQLTGALTLPPRRLAHNDLPIGGYADVTTRGHVDQILPSQFALDDWDFVRRYAERELLYFRREEPHVQTRQDLLVLLDQGVRTWGDVRIVLGAALIAFGKQALKRKIPFRIATTGKPRIIDPLETDAQTLGEAVEASDLSSNPGLALERLLEQPVQGLRDIVLLTHPRSLREEDVRAAAKRLRPDTRLFALSLDRDGHAALHELRHGAPVIVREFRVDFAQAAPLPSEPLPTPETRETGGWSGDIEPIPFPFHFGLNGVLQPHKFDFDPIGKFLLTAGAHGMLYLWNIDGSLAEILPRGVARGDVVNWVTFVTGVADGFAVVALRPEAPPVLLHYHMDRRRCTAYTMGDGTGDAWGWNYSPAHHCFMVSGTYGFVVDLGTGEKYATNLGSPRNRAQIAWEAWQSGQVPPRRLADGAASVRAALSNPFVTLDSQSGSVTLRLGQERASSRIDFTPLADGRPMLQGHVLPDAQHRAGTLALQALKGADLKLCLFRVTGTLLGQYAMRRPHPGFALSPDGRLLARQVSQSTIEFSHVAGSITPLGRTWVGGFNQQVLFTLGDYHLTLLAGGSLSLSWADGILTCQRDVVLGGDTDARRKAVHSFLQNDRGRWTASAQRRLIAASDRYGQIALFDTQAKLICMFFAFRNRLSGWMPDGTRFGPPGLPPRPEIMRKFGKALWLASVKG